MKLFGSLKELVSAVFRKDSQEITLKPSTLVTYNAARNVELPAQNSDAVLVSRNSQDTLTNKTIDGDDNTLQDIGISSLKTVLADANKALLRDASGIVTSSFISNDNVAASAGIVDTKLATISTAGKVSNSATTATSSNTASTIVARDASGNFSAGTITASLSGNATNVTGTVAIANGGTGQTTANAALNALLPSQSSQTGKVLGTDGSNTSWTTAATLPSAGTAGSVYSNGSALTLTGTFTGNGNKVIGVNSGATAEEYKSLAVGTSGTDFTIDHTTGVVTFNLPSASATARGVVTTGAQTFAGVKTFSAAPVISDASGIAQATATTRGVVYASRFQTKILASNVQGNGSQQTISGLTFNNLTAGKTYRVSGYIYLIQGVSNTQNEVAFFDGSTSGTRIGSAQTNAVWSSGFTELSQGVGVSFIFTAANTTMTTSYTAGSSASVLLVGNGTKSRSFITLEEIDCTSTTAWT